MSSQNQRNQEDFKYFKMIYLKEEEIPSYMVKFEEKLASRGYSPKDIENISEYHFKNDVIIKYNKEKQDEMWNNLMETWSQKGGTQVLISYCMQPHSVFEHYSQIARKSAEKDNLTPNMEEKEYSKKDLERKEFLKQYFGDKWTRVINPKLSQKESIPKDL